METKYGLISDIHRIRLEAVFYAISVLKNEGIDKLILNGDLVGDQNSEFSEMEYFSNLLAHVAQSGLETYIQPGSHEEKREYGPIINAFSEKYSNINNILEKTSFQEKDHNLLFIPGSDVIAGKVQEGYGIAINGFEKYFVDPEKTIVFSHVPRKFNNINEAVDYAFFAEFKNGTFGPAIPILEQLKSTYGNLNIEDAITKALDHDINLRQENRGNEDLKYLFEKTGINKCISGHFHESVHRANDSNGKHVLEGEFVDELFWNASYLDEGKIGVLRVKDNKVAYQNLNIKDY